MSNEFGLGLGAVALCMGLLAACSSASDDYENNGVVQLSIAEVPTDVGCMEIEVIGNRKAEQRFDVTPGKPAEVRMESLPVGNVSVTAMAYRGTCDAVVATSTPIWMSDATPVTLIAGEPVNATLKLRKNGIGNFKAEFEDDDAGASCPAGRLQCAEACVDPLTDRNNCGGCGKICMAAMACINGACTCPNNRQLCGMQCVDTQNDRNNCGACSRRCGTNSVCMDGTCELLNDCGLKPGMICP